MREETARGRNFCNANFYYSFAKKNLMFCDMWYSTNWFHDRSMARWFIRPWLSQRQKAMDAGPVIKFNAMPMRNANVVPREYWIFNSLQDVKQFKAIIFDHSTIFLTKWGFCPQWLVKRQEDTRNTFSQWKFLARRKYWSFAGIKWSVKAIK